MCTVTVYVHVHGAYRRRPTPMRVRVGVDLRRQYAHTWLELTSRRSSRLEAR